MKIGPETACKFYTFEFVRAELARSRGKDVPLSPLDNFVAGGSAGLCSQTIIYPLEIAKTRLAISPQGEYQGVFDCLSKIVGRESVFALYRGLVPSLLGVIPYAGVDLSVYTYLTGSWRRENQGKSVPVPILLFCGSVSCVCGQLVSYPFQLVRTKLQAQGAPGRPEVYKGTRDCFRKVIATESVFGLYRGLVPNIMKAVPAVSITYVVYENMKAFLGVPSK